MANKVGSFTISTTGTLNISSLGFDPNEVEFWVGAKNGSSAVLTSSNGAVDSAGSQNVIYEYDDHAGNYSYNTDQSNCIWLIKHSGGWSNELKASFNGWITGGFSLSVAAANSSYQVFYRARTT